MQAIASMLCGSIIASALMLGAVVAVRYILLRRTRRQHDAHRGLFVFSDGGRQLRAVDPILALLALEEHAKFRFDRHPKAAAEGEREAIEICVDAVRTAFGVPEYSKPNQPGLTVGECLQLLRAFMHYVASQKKSTDRSPTAPQSTESTSSSSESPTTSDSLPAGSTATAVA